MKTLLESDEELQTEFSGVGAAAGMILPVGEIPTPKKLRNVKRRRKSN